MKLMRVGPKGHEKPALLDAQGKVRDLSGILCDITPHNLTPEGQAALRAIDTSKLPVIDNPGRIAPPWTGVGKFVAIGLNYSDHAAETGQAVPTEPILFTKSPNTLIGPDDDVLIPRGATKTDWEVELGIVIGRHSSYLADEAEAAASIAGYVLVNDVSERAWQMERNGQWSKGKSAPTFNPAGPYLVTPDEVGDVLDLRMTLDVDGRRRQDGSTATMIFSPAFIVHYLSQFMALEPGDLINTGTPPGVGMGQKPPTYLHGGEVMTLSITRLGTQTQRVIAASAS